MRNTIRWVGLFSAAALMLLTPGITSAQAVRTTPAAVDNFSRNRNTSVQQRSRPAYEAAGVRSGAFLIYPRVELSAESVDNIYATETGTVDDTVFRLRPELSVESDWNRNLMVLYARGSVSRYSDNHDENTDEFGLGGSARLDVSRQSSIAFGSDFASGYEPRSAPSAPRNAASPTALDMSQAYISASRSAGYVKLSGRADWRALDYGDGRTGLGAVIDQDHRDRDVASLSGRLDLAVSPDTAFFVQATANERTYDVRGAPTTPSRDSQGAEYLAGASFELSAVIRGEVAVGYIEQRFDHPGFQDISGLGVRVQVEWFASELTTVSLAGGRTVEDTPVSGVGAYAANSTSLGVDHELLRNLILTGRLTWSQDDYEGVDRQDVRFGATLGATYLLNRNLGLNTTVSTLETRSRGFVRDQDYSVIKLAISLVAQF